MPLVKVFLTGGTGFIGGHVARKLRTRGDAVVALVRSPEKAGPLRELGCELVEGDLASSEAIARGVVGADAVVHAGAVYKVGIPKSQHAAMYESNVRGTERVLDAAIEANVPRIVYVSTCAVFGDTHGQLVDEGHRRDSDFPTEYERTKTLAHELAEDRIAKGAPIVIVQPGGVYGPGDHSELGNVIDQVRTGKMPAKMFPQAGIMLCHVEDIAAGIVLALDKGEIGEAYVLSGEQATLGELVDRVAAIADRRPPRFTMPGVLLRLSAPLGPVVGPVLGFPPNIGELIRSTGTTTYWATDVKARRELGFAPRDLDTGLRQTVAASR
jgi:nucleoside-diphosphate-sugar epimerase